MVIYESGHEEKSAGAHNVLRSCAEYPHELLAKQQVHFAMHNHHDAQTNQLQPIPCKRYVVDDVGKKQGLLLKGLLSTFCVDAKRNALFYAFPRKANQA